MSLSIGKRLSQLRKQHQYSQQDLATKLNISRQTISKWEQDLSLPDLESLLKMTELYDTTLQELIGIEEEKTSLSDVYNQLQIVLNNLQKSNRAKNILQVILIIICALSLGLTFSLTKQEPVIDYGIDFNQSKYTNMSTVDIFELEHELIDTSSYDSSFLDVDVYDLENLTLTTHYQLTLTSYTPTTQVFITLDDLTFAFEKVADHLFILKKTIPLDDYHDVKIKICHDEHLTHLINLNDSHAFEYFRHALYSQLTLLIPINDDHQLQLDTIEYHPNFLDTHQFKGLLKGSVEFKLYNEDQNDVLFSQTFQLHKEKTFTLKQHLPLNQQIYVTAIVNIPHATGGYTYYLHGMTSNDTSSTYFVIPSDSSEIDVPIFRIYHSQRPTTFYTSAK